MKVWSEQLVALPRQVMLEVFPLMEFGPMKNVTLSMLSLITILGLSTPAFAADDSSTVDPLTFAGHVEGVAEAVVTAPIASAKGAVAGLLMSGFDDKKDNGGPIAAAAESAIETPIEQINRSATSSDLSEAHPLCSMVANVGKGTINGLDHLLYGDTHNAGSK
ncbi:MAG TPA: hypothetical protein V6C72_17940 [Chroococcales cyanobacterium]